MSLVPLVATWSGRFLILLLLPGAQSARLHDLWHHLVVMMYSFLLFMSSKTYISITVLFMSSKTCFSITASACRITQVLKNLL